MGTLRRDAVRFGEARSGSRGKLWRCEAWRVLAGLDGAVKALRGMSRLSEERLVKAWLGEAAGVWHVEVGCSMSRRIMEWRVMSRQSRRVESMRRDASYGLAGQSRRGLKGSVEARF